MASACDATHRHSSFATTRWSAVAALGASDLPLSRKALTWLCESYGQPLYVYARGRGCSTDQAQDVVQDFFTRVSRSAI